ncbi:GTP-binding protein, partial [Nocardia farcinica]|uniref:GTP-binding protein n=1 Tax=Nocardia farcinica TaxID=37329 RepID=UPI003CC7FC33
MVLPDPAPLPPRPDRRTPVLLVAGLPGRASAAVDRAAAALAHAEGTVVVRHHLEDLREGVVRRTLRTVLATTETVLELAHGCVSCTLRADLLPLLCTLAARESVHRIVLELDPAFEAEAVCQAIEDVVVTGVVVAVPAPGDPRPGSGVAGQFGRAVLGIGFAVEVGGGRVEEPLQALGG